MNDAVVPKVGAQEVECSRLCYGVLITRVAVRMDSAGDYGFDLRGDFAGLRIEHL